MSEEPDDLTSLGVELVGQDTLEHQIASMADTAMLERDKELELKRLEKTKSQIQKWQSKQRSLESKINSRNTKISERERFRKGLKDIEENELKVLRDDLKEINIRLQETMKASSLKAKETLDEVEQLPNETKKDFLIRTGKITAFGSVNAFTQDNPEAPVEKSHQSLIAPGIDDDDDDYVYPGEIEEIEEIETENESDDQAAIISSKKRKRARSIEHDDVYVNSDSAEDEYDTQTTRQSKDEIHNIDDGDDEFYNARLNAWVTKRSQKRELDANPDEEEWFKPHPTKQDAILDDDYRLPGDVYPALFDYQKTCVQWLWELYLQKVGGILGDEMGLGKTVQIISFIAGLHYTKKLNKPVIVVCPATVLRQWCNEFHRWWPPLRVVILHAIGTGLSGSRTSLQNEASVEKLLEEEEYGSTKSLASLKAESRVKELIDSVFTRGHVIITTYVGLRIYSKHLLKRDWGYAILDEGHKIRNPNSDISLTCKQLRTPNRVILSGTPIQNNLTELWSLFDFIFPGRLGTLPVFQNQFAIPINVGGYANATNLQVQVGYKCAVTLKDLISPYLLRRVKADVAKDLPKKSEMVLFCKLTAPQHALYEKFLRSDELSRILQGKRQVLYGIDILRKICNHPDLVDVHAKRRSKKDPTYGSASKSGKMQVVKKLLELWKSQGHKTLLFTQTRQMLDILESFLERLNEKGAEEEGFVPFKFLRMDGTTSIGVRQSLVDVFNNDPSYNVFLLTTRVGGLGVNLTGANRVIIYDPDWNPSTDVQARERAWRLGQKKDVTIYRLMIAGSIEEKIYHRQIFKQFLTNKILKDPKQRRFFKMNELQDLFTLGDPDEKGTETGDMFNGMEYNFKGTKPRHSQKLSNRERSEEPQDDLVKLAQINGVSGLQEFDGSKDEQMDSSSRQEEELMSGLFASSGVHSALQHDSIMDSTEPEQDEAELEARRIAAEAANSLRESRKLARKSKIGVPTWTGKFGSAGKILNKQRFRDNASGVSSSSILQSIRAKRDLDTKKKERPDFNNEDNDRKLLIKRINDFMLVQNGYKADSQTILNSFKEINNIILMRSMLKQICKWDSKEKVWILKDEYVE
ncbi:hypothetical protein LJB42_004565 [Komagataella kurtzmanii]|nr:hypothetical protein LJB42_004565 [Komagataella kurtzmanii]